MAVFSHVATSRTCRFTVFCVLVTTTKVTVDCKVLSTREKIGLLQRSSSPASGTAINVVNSIRRSKTSASVSRCKAFERGGRGVGDFSHALISGGPSVFTVVDAVLTMVANGSGLYPNGSRFVGLANAFSAGLCSLSAVLSAVSSRPFPSII